MDSYCRVGAIVEGKTTFTNNYAIASSTGSPSGENMHRQVYQLLFIV